MQRVEATIYNWHFLHRPILIPVLFFPNFALSHCTNPVSATLCVCISFLLYFRIAETDAEAQQWLQKWNKFLESGEVAGGGTAEENKGKVAVIEGKETSANNTRNGSVMSTDTDFEMSEKRNEGNVDTLMEVKGGSEVDKSDNISAEGSSDVVVEGGSCAAKSDDVEGDRHEYEGNGEGNRMVENG